MTAVVLGSMFRDAGSYADRYFDQVQALRWRLESRGDSLRLIVVEDHPEKVDEDWGPVAQLAHNFGQCLYVQVTDGCPYYPSHDIPQRWRHLAWVANHVLRNVRASDDVCVYVESDLVWDPRTILRLIDLVRGCKCREVLDPIGNKVAERQGSCDEDPKVEVVSPMLMLQHSNRYYDTWGTRLNGRRFSPWRPHHEDLPENGLVEVDSVAGCTVMKASIARRVRFQKEDCYVGLCRDIWSKGHKVWLSLDDKVEHPAELLRIGPAVAS